MNKQTHYIATGDALIHTEVYGEGHLPFLILLHGNGEDLHCFDQQIAHFADRYIVVAIDTRAHGLSSRGNKPLDFHTFSEDVWAVMDELNIEAAHFIGFSDGAILALHLALKKPERVKSMILIGANYTPRGFIRKEFLLIRSMYALLCISSLFSEKQKRKKEVWELMVKHPKLTLEELARIQTPAYIVTGEKDMVSQSENDEMHRVISGSKRYVMPHADHFIPTKQAEELNRIADEFLSSLGAHPD